MKTPIIEGFSQADMVSYLTARLYDQLYWPTFFPLKNVNMLSGKTLIGAVGSRVAAHVISYNAKSPEAGRKAVSTLDFDIPKIAQKRTKNENEILEMRITQALRGADAVLEDYYNDLDFVYDSCQARMEWYALQALSTTKLQLTVANNPQGIVNETVIDFGMPTANKKTVSVIWSTGNVALMDPLADLQSVVTAARKKGVTFARILMTSDTYDLMAGATKMVAYFLNPALSVTNPISLDGINRLLGGYRVPPITLIDTSLGIEAKSGVITEANPWSTTHITFIPDVKCGEMFNGPIAEELEKPIDVLQAKRSNILVSVHKEFDPVKVVTKGECNVFPSWPTVDRCYSLYTGHASTWA